MCLFMSVFIFCSELNTGEEFDLVCRLELDLAVDSNLLVTSSWTKDGSPISSDGSRLTISDPERVQESPLMFESVLMFRTLDASVDSGNYGCMLVIQAVDDRFINGTTTTVSMGITVEGRVWSSQCVY